MTDFEKWFYTEDAEKFGLYPDIHSARAAWNYQETKLKEMDEVIKLQDADLRKYEKQIEGLKEQLNNMEACYIEKKKQVEECAALAAGWNEIAWDKTTHWTEGYEEGCYHCSAQIEEALRGGS